jgi:hypothetical protein
MTKKSPETFRELVDTLASCACYAEAGRRIGVHPVTILRWINASAASPDDYLVEWGGEVAPLHIQARRAVRYQIASVEANSRHRSLVGHTELLWHGGAPVLARDLRISPSDAADQELCQLLWGQPDDLLRVNGQLVQASQHHHPSDGLVKMVLSAHLPKLYGTKIDQTVTHAGGVMVVGASAPRPAPVAAPIQPMRIEPPKEGGEAIDEAEFTEVDQHTELRDLDPQALAAGHHPDDQPEPPRSQAPQAPRPMVDRDMQRHGEGVGAGVVAPGGYAVR